jgi:hypothetical protein
MLRSVRDLEGYAICRLKPLRLGVDPDFGVS